jgi:hypothetical protein
MRRSARAALAAAAVIVCCPEAALAGMPSITLSDLARMRVQTISFFLAALLLSSGLVQLLWNHLRKDFPSLPRLTYRKALGVVVLWGLLFVLVLTMISGARELMTPGAWEKQGFTYRLAQEPAAPPAEGAGEAERYQQLRLLRAALWEYAESHGGQFPSPSAAAEIPAPRWLVPGTQHTHYLYVGGTLVREGGTPLAYEAEVFGPQRLVLLTSGEVTRMSTDDLLKALPPEGR